MSARYRWCSANLKAAGSSSGVEDASFWQGWSEKVIKALLHAAAWGGAGIDDLWRRTQSAAAANAGLAVLQNLEGRATNGSGGVRVEPGWADTLAQVVDGDEKFRGNVWAGDGKALPGLDLHAVRRRFDPEPGDGFDAEAFLAAKGTLTCWRRATTRRPDCCNAWSPTSPGPRRQLPIAPRRLGSTHL